MNIISQKTSIFGLLIGGALLVSWYLYVDMYQTQQAPALSENKGLGSKQSAEINSSIDKSLVMKKASTLAHEAKIVGKLNTFAHEMQVLRDRLDKLVQISNSAQETNDEMAKMEELNLDEQDQEAKAQVADQLALFDRVAEREGVDQKWAAAAQDKVYQSFQNLMEDGIGVSEVKCHSSLCQARFSLDTEEDTNIALQKLQGVTPWEGESFIWIEDTELGEGVIYLAREGVQLPY